MPIDKNRIFTMSAGDYSRMVQIDLAYYYALGVQAEMVNPKNLMDQFNQLVPNEAEAVVAFRMGGMGGGDGLDPRGYAVGTALVRRGMQAAVGQVTQ